MHRLMLPLLLGTLLSACQAPLPSTPAARQEEARVSFDSNKTSKLAAPGALVTEVWGCSVAGQAYMTIPVCSPNYFGNGTFTPLGYGSGGYRVSFTVPPDRVLCINSIIRASDPFTLIQYDPRNGEVVPHLYINSIPAKSEFIYYNIYASTNTSLAITNVPSSLKPMYFGPGQTVICAFPVQWYGNSLVVDTLVSGYTISADAFAASGGVLGVK